jgi:hypothetical protein
VLAPVFESAIDKLRQGELMVDTYYTNVSICMCTSRARYQILTGPDKNEAIDAIVTTCPFFCEIIEGKNALTDTADLLRRSLQDVALEGNARVVDQDTRVAMLRAYGVGSSVNSLHRGDITLVVVDLLVRLHVCGK